jgi:hypothetical protein
MEYSEIKIVKVEDKDIKYGTEDKDRKTRDKKC